MPNGVMLRCNQRCGSQVHIEQTSRTQSAPRATSAPRTGTRTRLLLILLKTARYPPDRKIADSFSPNFFEHPWQCTFSNLFKYCLNLNHVNGTQTPNDAFLQVITRSNMKLIQINVEEKTKACLVRLKKIHVSELAVRNLQCLVSSIKRYVSKNDGSSAISMTQRYVSKNRRIVILPGLQ